MREDQYIKLKAIEVELIDLFIEEGTPRNWPGYGTPIKDQTKEDRGDAVWCKKSAAQTLLVASRVANLTQHHEGTEGPSDPTRDDLEAVERNRDAETAAVTREAMEFIARARGRGGKS